MSKVMQVIYQPEFAKGTLSLMVRSKYTNPFTHENLYNGMSEEIGMALEDIIGGDWEDRATALVFLDAWGLSFDQRQSKKEWRTVKVYAEPGALWLLYRIEGEIYQYQGMIDHGEPPMKAGFHI